jgi:hypothetical protein
MEIKFIVKPQQQLHIKNYEALQSMFSKHVKCHSNVFFSFSLSYINRWNTGAGVHYELDILLSNKFNMKSLILFLNYLFLILIVSLHYLLMIVWLGVSLLGQCIKYRAIKFSRSRLE